MSRICKVISHRELDEVSKRTGNYLFGTIVNIVYLTPKTRKAKEQDSLWVDDEVCSQFEIHDGSIYECTRARNGYVLQFRKSE